MKSETNGWAMIRYYFFFYVSKRDRISFIEYDFKSIGYFFTDNNIVFGAKN